MARFILHRGKYAEKQIHNDLTPAEKSRLCPDGWVYGNFVAETPETQAHIIKTGDPLDEFTGKRFTVIDNTVGEYIGQDDIHEKPIFDGDIIKCAFGGKEYVGVIQWQPQEARFLIYDGGDWLPLDATDDKIGLEIIGNIYDTPELLKEA